MSKIREMNKVEPPADLPYTLEWIRAKDLEVDPEVQREKINHKVVDLIRQNWNDDLAGVITVIRRDPVTQIIIDGWHRHRARMEDTDGEGLLLCKVFEGLTPQQESLMFIGLNPGNRPSPIDKWRQELRAEDEIAVEVHQLVQAFGWTVGGNPGDGVIQAVSAVKRIYQRSVDREKEPNTLLLTLKLVTHAWGHDRDAVAAVMLEGISAFLGEHGDRIEFSVLEERLKAYAGGPYVFHQNATALAGHRRVKVSMAVAELLVDLWNKSRPTGSPKALPAWTKRSP